ncbi:uncharacterized protein LOC131620019 [Vicia villosa]|uniref:uncharacterized protein LOC131620019 n=1 Tax=Vicia villosa TaxID=3911 RepID=UPI00273CDBE4|nr:uncharacterized protein LOC131620019 [Vicia villosa]
MLHWIRTEATKLGFGVVIGRYDYDTFRINEFVTLTCERSGKYIRRIQKLKRDDTGSRKCECPFRLCGYLLANNKWKFNVICGLHNYDLCQKLAGHPIASRLLPDEKTCVSDMTLSLVPPKNILATLKRKRPGNTSNIKQVYNRRYQSKLALRGDRTEMQHLMELLDENNYVYQQVQASLVGNCWCYVDRDTTLMNSVATVFLTSYALLCKYHITKNVKGRVKPAVETKQIACEDGKLVKTDVIVEKIMDAWNVIVSASTKVDSHRRISGCVSQIWVI